jgi:AAHS family 4-hydroxybenzoate transporter-like MFS transporter
MSLSVVRVTVEQCHVAEVVAVGSLKGMPFRAWLILSIFLMLDGLDLALLGLLAPDLAAEFSLDPAQVGLLLGSQQVGVAIAGILGGAAGDRFGRRTIIAGSVALFGLFTVIAAFASSAGIFVIARTVAGLGLGALSPNVASYLTETLPLAWRGRLTAGAFVAIAVGAILSTVLVKGLGDVLDWRSLFFICGAIPVMLIPLILFIIPESPIWMATRRRPAGAIAAALNRLTGERRFTSETKFIAAGEQDVAREATAARRTNFLASIPLRDTIALWCIIFALQFLGAGMTHMGPTVLAANGLDIAHAAQMMLWYNLAGLAGALIAAWLLPLLGSLRLYLALSIVMLASFLILYAMLVARISGPALGYPVAMCGFAVTGLSLIGFPLAAAVYPTENRATGVGAAAGVGRVGSVVAPAMIGLWMSGFGPARAFEMQIPVAIMLFVATLLLRRHIPPLKRRPG